MRHGLDSLDPEKTRPSTVFTVSTVGLISARSPCRWCLNRSTVHSLRVGTSATSPEDGSLLSTKQQFPKLLVKKDPQIWLCRKEWLHFHTKVCPKLNLHLCKIIKNYCICARGREKIFPADTGSGLWLLCTSCEELRGQFSFFAQISLKQLQLLFLCLQHLWSSGSCPYETEDEVDYKY